ncbi:MAG: endolytic transglycosylase MltG [Oscillospiraceae bacterium]|nr:endolytic transglycosylase MltG [Oscillospiraceae bacterium]
MDEKKDEFWDEFLKETNDLINGENTKPIKENTADDPDFKTGSIKIEYLNEDGESVGQAEDLRLEQSAAAEEFDRPGEAQDSMPVVSGEKKPEQKEKKIPVILDPLAEPGDRKKKKEKEFEVDFDFDEEYPDEDEKIVSRGAGRRTGCLSGVLFFIFVVCISVALAAFGWMCATDVLGLGDENNQITVSIPKEIFTVVEREKTNADGEKEMREVSVADMGYIASMLKENGLIKYEWLFKLYSKFSSADEKVKAGTYVLNTDFDYRALVYGMTPSAGERVVVDVTIPEGHNVFQVVQDLTSNGVCDEDELWDCLANYDFEYEFLDRSTLGDKLRLEGYLFPDTYSFYVGDTPSRVIGKLLKNFDRKWTDEMTEQAKALGYTQREILIVASMIEKEAGADSERATIASVIYNRLRDGGQGTNYKLQIDATLYYAAQIEGVTMSKDIDSPYNTYLVTGLPAGPIANPGLASIKAALDPEITNYYYYALGKEGVHHFSKTLEEHTAFVNSDEYGG